MNIDTKRQEEIKSLWEQFKSGITEADSTKLKKDVEHLLLQWKSYRDKILDDSFTLDDYTNRIDITKAQMPGGYLCNFLERTTRILFGSSKPGNAHRFGIKLNSDGTTYTHRENLNIDHDKDYAIEIFNKDIKPLIKKIVNCENACNKGAIVENSKYAAKQILRKLSILDHQHDFIFIYSDDVIDALHKEFINSEESLNLNKNYEVRAHLNQLLNIKDTYEENVLLSNFLWKYANTQSLADQDSPNVILYGPPGTGKTYSVKNSLDFLCQGDRSRYEFVQFHPSFTYEDFIEGIKPKGVSVNGNIKFELVDGRFKRFCKKAKANPDKNYYFIVDEINRANLSSVFGETLMCLEKDYRHDGKSDDNLIKTQYSALIEDMIGSDESKNKSMAYHYSKDNDGEHHAYFGVPKNIFFIGMMNDVDKSIDAFDLALRRRFKWIRKDCDYDVIDSEVKFRNGQDFNNIEKYRNACEKLNLFISEKLGMGKSYEFGHSFFMNISSISSTKTISQANMKKLFELYLQPTLKEYLRAMFPENELDKNIDKALDIFIAPLKKK